MDVAMSKNAQKRGSILRYILKARTLTASSKSLSFCPYASSGGMLQMFGCSAGSPASGHAGWALAAAVVDSRRANRW
jgi:hypothetical protein